MARVQSPLKSAQGLCIAVVGRIRRKGVEDGQEFCRVGWLGLTRAGNSVAGEKQIPGGGGDISKERHTREEVLNHLKLK